MTYRCKILLVPVFLLQVSCFLFDDDSMIPDEQQDIIRRILNENGYDLSSRDLVDDYVGKNTDPHTGAWFGKYDLLIPKAGYRAMVLTDDINILSNNFFCGAASCPSNSTADTVIIKTDSIIYIPKSLGLGTAFRSIPKEINKIRTKELNFRYNQVTTLPEEIMELTEPPFPYDTFYINVQGNRIDTTTISDTLDKWLQKYSSPYWKAGQEYAE